MSKDKSLQMTRKQIASAEKQIRDILSDLETANEGLRVDGVDVERYETTSKEAPAGAMLGEVSIDATLRPDKA